MQVQNNVVYLFSIRQNKFKNLEIMKTLKTEELELTYANAMFSGYGHNKVTVELQYKGERKKFNQTTTNLEAVDEAKELGVDSWEDKTFALYEIVANDIEDEVFEWMEEVDLKEKEKEDEFTQNEDK